MGLISGFFLECLFFCVIRAFPENCSRFIKSLYSGNITEFVHDSVCNRVFWPKNCTSISDFPNFTCLIFV